MVTKKTRTPLQAQMEKIQAGDAKKVRRCLEQATEKLNEALEFKQPAAKTAEDFLKLRTLRQALAACLAAFDERHGLRK